MKECRKYLVIGAVALLGWVCNTGLRAEEHYLVSHYSIENGMSQNTVMSILQDKQGYMWFGTWDGLNRFDGYNFQTFKAMENGEEAKVNNRVDIIYEDEEEQETKFDKFLNKITGGKAEKVLSAFVVAFSVILAVAIFIVLPYFITSLFKAYVRSSILMTIIEGCIRILIFLLYVVGISAMKDIKRLYMYHGAEHKCINCIERGKPLTVRNVMRSSRLHKRCGTSFMFFVLFISIILFFFIQVSNPVLKIVLRILLIPVIAGISYEIIRLAGRSDNIFIKILSAPGMAIQKLTTKEPTKDMVEVGIASVEAVFDWKKFLIEEFNYDPSYFEEESSENTEEDEQA